MPDIVIPEEKFEEFLRSLFVRITKIQEELVAEMVADVELFRAQMNAGYECKVRALEDKLRAFEEEVERQRQLERLRHAAAVERGERAQ